MHGRPLQWQFASEAAMPLSVTVQYRYYSQSRPGWRCRGTGFSAHRSSPLWPAPRALGICSCSLWVETIPCPWAQVSLEMLAKMHIRYLILVHQTGRLALVLLQPLAVRQLWEGQHLRPVGVKYIASKRQRSVPCRATEPPVWRVKLSTHVRSLQSSAEGV